MPTPPRPLANQPVVVTNDDNGSLRTGAYRLEVGDLVEFPKNNKLLRVTYVMGSERKGWHACFKGQGALPLGEVTWQLAGPEARGPGPRATQGTPPAAGERPRVKLAEEALSPAILRRMPARGVALFGFDSAWTVRNRGALSGLVVTPAGTRVLLPMSASFDEALEAIDELGRGVDVRLVAIDQPLIVPNQSGRRYVEDVVSVPIGRRLGGVQPANRKRVGMFDDGAPLWPFLEQLKASLDPDAALQPRRGTFAIEVFPALSNVTLFQTPARVEPLFKYNPERPTFRLADWRRLLESMAGTFAAGRLDDLAAWCREASLATAPTKLQQDSADSLVCLLTALRWWDFGRTQSEVVGDVARGYIVVPVDDALRGELEAARARYA